MNYADIVNPGEMQAKRDWVEHTLGLLAGPSGGGGRAEATCLRQGWGSFELGQSVVAAPIRLNGKTHATGFGTHVDSEILVTLSRPGARLTGLAGADYNVHTHESPPSIFFSIEVAGKAVWKSDEQSIDMAPARFSVPLKGATRFTLKAWGRLLCGHADWADLRVAFTDGTSIPLGEPRPFLSGPAFSFTYGGKSSNELLGEWKLAEEPAVERDGLRTRRFVWTDPKTALACILEMKEYLDFPVVEWGLRFKNTGSKPTPILENIRSMDLRFAPGPKMYLNYYDGDYNTAESYQPHRLKLADGMRLHFAPEGGRPTNKAWPYYNMECPKAQMGAILVVGWSGQWSAQFECTKDHRGVVAGQELAHFKLLPGEEVRTPISVVMFWTGDRVRSQNLWRRWMIAHNTPRPGGKLPGRMYRTCLGLHQNEKDETAYIKAHVKHGRKFTEWVLDAGWYPTPSVFWWSVGTWKPDPVRFPNGIRPVSDLLRKNGIKLGLWFEPERVAAGTELDVEHPEFLLSCPSDSNKLLDLGNPAAWKWLVERVDSLIVSEGVGVYRQDHNFDPLPFWRENDAEDRQGITEIRHVEGYLAFWDELLRRHPALLIDTCASGGRRNDIETLRRSIPLLRSDYTHAQDPTGDPNVFASGNQGHTYGLAQWVPWFGSGANVKDIYLSRSHLCPCAGLGADPLKDYPRANFKRMEEDWLRMEPYFIGDFYPLTPYSLDEDAWMAWQFHRTDLDGGFVQVFRHTQSPFSRACFRLSGLNANSTYDVTDLDHPRLKRRATGKELMEEGLPVKMAEARSSAIVLYEKCAE